MSSTPGLRYGVIATDSHAFFFFFSPRDQIDHLQDRTDWLLSCDVEKKKKTANALFILLYTGFLSRLL